MTAPTRMSHVMSLAVLVAASLIAPDAVAARAVCADPRCGMVDVEIMPPIVVPPVDPGPPAPRAMLAVADVRGRLSTLGPRVDECFDTHFEGDRAPRAFPITVFVHPDGRWSLAFGPRARAPRGGDELRGTTPLEVCVADWVSSEIGPRLQPPGGQSTRGRSVRRVAVSFRPHLSPVPTRP